MTDSCCDTVPLNTVMRYIFVIVNTDNLGLRGGRSEAGRSRLKG